MLRNFAFLQPAAEAARRAGGRLCLVGGTVRDMLTPAPASGAAPPPETSRETPKEKSPDLDLVAFGLDLPRILEVFSPFGKTRPIGRRTTSGRDRHDSLVHLRLGDQLLEISPPRRPVPGLEAYRAGPGTAERDWAEFSSLATPLEDALARDFTLNAVFFDPLAGEYLDPLGGRDHLRERRLTLCHPLAFTLDPLRMLRAFGFISRYELAPGEDTLAACAGGQRLLAATPRDRFWPEWRKWALGRRPHLGLTFLERSGLLAFWPDLAALAETPQSPVYHPEGDAWKHTVLVVKAMSELELPPHCDRLVLTFAALLHDLGKPLVTEKVNGRWVSRGHAQAGLPSIRDFLETSIRAPSRLIRPVLKLTEHHMDLAFQENSSRALRRLARRLAPESNLAEFWALTACDWNGRGPSMRPFSHNLADFLSPLGGEALPAPPLLLGRDLLSAFPGRVKPGPELGGILRKLDDARDEGLLAGREDALAFAKKILDDGNDADYV